MLHAMIVQARLWVHTVRRASLLLPTQQSSYVVFLPQDVKTANVLLGRNYIAKISDVRCFSPMSALSLHWFNINPPVLSGRGIQIRFLFSCICFREYF